MKKKVVWLPYDMDTAIGINNEGDLVFSYNLEDIDKTETGADVFNGQESVIWVNLRQAFFNDIRNMYEQLRSRNVLSYDIVEKMFEEHQNKWPEAIFNEDGMFKYIDPLIEDGTGTYLAMLQGSKAEQRKWWLSNRFKYLDSKYNAGNAASDVIQIRGYAKANVTLTPYADIYASVKYGSYLQQVRANRGEEYTINCPLDNVNDTEIYIYSASQLASIGDLSGFKVGLADFSKAIRLQDVKVGDADPNYANENLGAGKNALTFGNNTLLKTIDVRNCINLGTGDQKSIDISHCSNIEEVYFDGTKIQGLQLPNGGVLRKLHLPATMTNLTIMNQRRLEEFVIPSYNNISSLRLENNNSVIDTRYILNQIPANTRVRLIGFNWECADSDEIDAIIEHLNTMRGLDEFDNTVEKAQVSGTIHLPFITGERLAYYYENYPYLNVTADHTTSVLRCYNYNGTQLLFSEEVNDGGDSSKYSGTPTRVQDAQYTYEFIGWSTKKDSGTADENPFDHVVADRNLYAAYKKTIRRYTVRFINNGEVLYIKVAVGYGDTVPYVGDEPTYIGTESGEYVFDGWLPTGENIKGNTDCIAQFKDVSSPLLQYLSRKITKYESDTATNMGYGAFEGCSNLEYVKAPFEDIRGHAFASCAGLKIIDLTSKNQVTFRQLWGETNAPLRALIIRSNTMANGTINMYTPSSLLKSRYQGAIYVPSDLVESYENDNYWKTYRILSIEDNDYMNPDFSTITDTWDEIIAAEEDGSYLTKYSLGDTKKLVINGTTYYMEIVGFNKDELSDGTGTAKITWISNNLMSPVSLSTTTTLPNGWIDTELPNYLNQEILSNIDQGLNNTIKSVNKTYKYSSGEGTIAEKIWIPSVREIYGESNSYAESSGCDYSDYFVGTKKIKYDAISFKSSSWWLRTMDSTTSCRYVDTSQRLSNASVKNKIGVAFGFCT